MALAKHLRRDPSWVTLYTAGMRHPDLDTSVQIATFFRLSLAEILGDALPEILAKDGQASRLSPEMRAALAVLTRELSDETPRAQLTEVKTERHTTRRSVRRR
jgi:hypothetical protein